MVLTMQPDFLRDIRPERAMALALAVFLHGMVLIGLSLPSDQPFELRADPPPPAIQAELVTIQELPQSLPVPQLPSPPVRPVEHQPITQVVQAVQHSALAEPSVASAPSAGTTAATAVDSGALATAGSAVAVPRVGPAYRFAPRPPYPGTAHRRRQSGTVVLRILVGRNGVPNEVQVHSSSGHAELDIAARNQVLRRWEFHPATADGRPIEAWVLVPIDFKLHGAR